MQKEQERGQEPRRKRGGDILIYGVVGILAVATGILSGYLFSSGDNPQQYATKENTPPSQSVPSQQGMGIKNLVREKQPQPVADISFVDSDGKPKHLSDWRGKVVLLNLWATWCGPCKLEMPSLDRLQAELGSKDFTVLAVSTDRTGLKEPAAFLEKAGVKNLGLYNDETAEATVKLQAEGLPLSIIVNADGQEVARLVGPAKWDSQEAADAVKSFLTKG